MDEGQKLKLLKGRKDLLDVANEKLSKAEKELEENTEHEEDSYDVIITEAYKKSKALVESLEAQVEGMKKSMQELCSGELLVYSYVGDNIISNIKLTYANNIQLGHQNRFETKKYYVVVDLDDGIDFNKGVWCIDGVTYELKVIAPHRYEFKLYGKKDREGLKNKEGMKISGVEISGSANM